MTQVTILPQQASFIAKLAGESGAAIGVEQEGSVLRLNLGSNRGSLKKPIYIDAQGNEIHYTRKRK